MAVNEFSILFDALLLGARHTIASRLPWSTCDDDTNTEPADTTTDDTRTDHELRLQYSWGN